MGSKVSWLRPALLVVAGLLAITLVAAFLLRPQPVWTEAELKKLNALALSSLPPVPPDPSNHVADNPLAAALGRDLFFDSRLSSTGYVSCATCHQPDKGFEDGFLLGQGVGLSKRRTPTLTGVAYATWLFWDGRKDSLWAQALEPLESPTEHGGNRLLYARTVAYQYADSYEAIFGPLPAVDWTKQWEALAPTEQGEVTWVFVNMAKSIEAYERTLTPAPTRFDAYVSEVSTAGNSTALSSDEVAGLKLFIGKADCVRCHSGPLFTDFEFHNTGVPAAAGEAPDTGWVTGLPLMLIDEFGCKGIWSDASPAAGCVDRRYLVEGLDNQIGAFKTPTLRGAAARGPYMHAGQFTTLEQVVQHYSTAPTAAVGTSLLIPANLTDEEMRQLINFLHALE